MIEIIEFDSDEVCSSDPSKHPKPTGTSTEVEIGIKLADVAKADRLGLVIFKLVSDKEVIVSSTADTIDLIKVDQQYTGTSDKKYYYGHWDLKTFDLVKAEQQVYLRLINDDGEAVASSYSQDFKGTHSKLAQVTIVKECPK